MFRSDLSTRRRLLVQHFDRQRDALAAADAQRDQAAREAVAAHRVDEFGGEHRAGRADRVAMGDGATFDVDDVFGNPSSRATTMAMAAKASLISTRSTEPMSQPARCNACLHRRHRPEAEHAGLDRRNPVGDEASRRRRPRLSAHVPSASTIAAAASFSPGALPAVMVPFGRKAGFSRASASSVVSGRLCSSLSNWVGPFLPGTSTGTICDLK